MTKAKYMFLMSLFVGVNIGAGSNYFFGVASFLFCLYLGGLTVK